MIVSGSLAGALALTVIAAGSANAVDTTTTFTVNSGSISISAPESANLGNAAPGAAITAQLGAVTVTDERALLTATWTLSVSSTAFTTGGGTPAETVATTSVGYWSGPATATTGSATFVPGQAATGNQVSLSSERVAFSVTAGVGNNSLTFNPTAVVNVPASAVGGVYTGTVTHSLG